MEIELGKTSCAYDTKEFCDRLISAVNIATAYRANIDQWNEEQKVSSIILNERHSKVTPEELASKWNIGIQTAKDTIRVTTAWNQNGNTSNDPTGTSGPLELTLTAIEGNVVCQHVTLKGKVKAW